MKCPNPPSEHHFPWKQTFHIEEYELPCPHLLEMWIRRVRRLETYPHLTHVLESNVLKLARCQSSDRPPPTFKAEYSAITQRLAITRIYFLFFPNDIHNEIEPLIFDTTT